MTGHFLYPADIPSTLLTLISVVRSMPYHTLNSYSNYPHMGSPATSASGLRLSYLTEKQLFRINSSCSSICSVLSGVIQGSVLGPLLFNVFINYVTDTLDNDTTAKLFADDLKLYTNITTSSTHNLQHQLNDIYLWSNAWQLPISFSKCTILHLGKSKVPLSKYSNY